MFRISRRQFGLGAIAGTVSSVAFERAFPQDFPSRAIRILVPYAAGGPSDAAARLVAEPLSRNLGQAVYVENRGGAGGLTATEAFFALPPDGYTILLGAVGPLVIIPAVKPVTYAPASDLIGLGTIWRSPQLLAVHPKLGVSNLDELIHHAKLRPATLSIGSAGIGSLTHLSLELFKREAGIDLIHVPFRSTGGTLPALLGGQIDLMFGDVALLAPYIRTGSLKGLAIAAPQRSALLPDLATFAESGLPKVHSENWYGLLLSARTPAPVISLIASAFQAAQKDTAYLDNLNRQGVIAGEQGRDAFNRLISEETKRWQPIVSAPGFKID